ncbi:MAG: cadherin domain-containing protein, partial [Pirellulaceae bacterium]|nr:cadherin domain-containing protein [Pirellulaceae bacterium]
RVTDNGGLTFDKPFTINVTNVNETPTNIALSNSTIAEGAPINTVIGNLSATDPDAADTFTFSLPVVLGDNASFNVSGVALRSSASFNASIQSVYNVTVRVTDAGGLTFNKSFVINVSDVNFPPTDISLAGNSVPESSFRNIHNPSPMVGDVFGVSVAISTDRILVGSTDGQVPRVNNGKAYLFDRSSGDLLVTLSSPNAVPGDEFGEQLAISGNIAVVSARLEDAVGIDSGRVYVFNATTGALLHTLTNPLPAAAGANDEFGRAVGISGNLIVIGARRDAIAPNAGAVYLFDATTGNLLQSIVSPIANSNDTFGDYLHVSGNTIVVGAILNDFGATNSGRAYIYQFNSGTNTASLTATINNPSPANGDFFGAAVAVSGNVVAISSLNDDTGATDAGQVYLFNATTGALLNTLSNPDPNADDRFGHYLAMADNHLIVSSILDDTNGISAGRTYIYNATTGVLESKLSHPFPAPVNYFGRAVAVSGDTFVISAFNDDLDGPDVGNVYSFSLSNGMVVGTLSTTDQNPSNTFTYSLLDDAGGRFTLLGNQIRVADSSKLDFEVANAHNITVRVADSSLAEFTKVLSISVSNATEPPRDILFTGNSVAENAANGTVVSTLTAADPDVASSFTFSLLDNASGRFAIVGNTIVVANSTLLDFETNTSHRVVVQVTDGTGLRTFEPKQISVTDVLPSDIFISNNSVAESTYRILHNPAPAVGDVFGVSVAVSNDRILVGSNEGQIPRVNNGKAYLYDKVSGNLLATLVSPNAAPDDEFGEQVAISGNIAVVSARFEDAVGVNSGRVYVYDATTGALLHTLTNPVPAAAGANDEFGRSVSISGNLIAVGSRRDAVAPIAGAVYLFDALTGVLLYTILSPTPNAADIFGDYIHLSGNTVVVGAILNDVGATNSGRAYVYQFNPGTNSAALLSTLSNPSPGAGDFFGAAVAVSGNIVAVSALNDDTDALNAGQVYLFNATTGALLNTLSNPDPNVDDRFGHYLAMSGNRLIVASILDDTDGISAGRTYIYDAMTGLLQTKLSHPLPNHANYFGRGLAVSGDTFVVSAINDDRDGLDFGNVYSFNIANGQIVGSLSTNDSNPAIGYTYTLLDNAGGRFALQGNQVIVSDASKLDFEQSGSHNITVKVTDPNANTFTKVIPINITGVNEPPRDITVVGSSVVENSATGTLVSTLGAADQDAGSSFTFTLLDNAGGRFATSGNTIVVANGSLVDFETNSSHSILVRVTDNTGLSTFESLTITVIDVAGSAAGFVDQDNMQSAIPSLASFAEAEGSLPMQNPRNPADVNWDGIVSPIDVLLVINRLQANSRNSHSDFSTINEFVDVNGDLKLSPIDALIAINTLNRLSRNGSQVDGEGDALSHDQALAQMAGADYENELSAKKRSRMRM